MGWNPFNFFKTAKKIEQAEKAVNTANKVSKAKRIGHVLGAAGKFSAKAAYASMIYNALFGEDFENEDGSYGSMMDPFANRKIPPEKKPDFTEIEKTNSTIELLKIIGKDTKSIETKVNRIHDFLIKPNPTDKGFKSNGTIFGESESENGDGGESNADVSHAEGLIPGTMGEHVANVAEEGPEAIINPDEQTMEIVGGNEGVIPSTNRLERMDANTADDYSGGLVTEIANKAIEMVANNAPKEVQPNTQNEIDTDNTSFDQDFESKNTNQKIDVFINGMNRLESAINTDAQIESNPESEIEYKTEDKTKDENKIDNDLNKIISDIESFESDFNEFPEKSVSSVAEIPKKIETQETIANTVSSSPSYSPVQEASVTINPPSEATGSITINEGDVTVSNTESSYNAPKTEFSHAEQGITPETSVVPVQSIASTENIITSKPISVSVETISSENEAKTFFHETASKLMEAQNDGKMTEEEMMVQNSRILSMLEYLIDRISPPQQTITPPEMDEPSIRIIGT